jgi:hypothetical protein
MIQEVKRFWMRIQTSIFNVRSQDRYADPNGNQNVIHREHRSEKTDTVLSCLKLFQFLPRDNAKLFQ